MKFNALFLCVGLIAGGVLVLLGAPSAFACLPLDDSMTRCDRVRLPRPASTVASIVKAPAVSVPTSIKRGMSPFDAMEVNDTWQTINANTGLWYKIGDGIDRVHLDVWLDANGKSGIDFAVYSPEQFNDLSTATIPKGRGTANRNDRTHDLSWSGQAPAGGTWYVYVNNSNSTGLSYKVGYNRVVTGSKNCSDPYAEYVGGNVNHELIWPGFCP